MRTSSVELSFCIPVYNFGRFVAETLDSIIANAIPELSFEILVLDGGSTDNTPEVLHQYCARHDFVRYVRKESRGGIDADLDETVSLAKGEYCWLLSGDDTLRAGALKALAGFLASKSDVYLCEHTQCDLNLNFLHDHPIFASRSKSAADLSVGTLREHYLRNALNTEACFSFMSGLIVRRQLWLSANPPEAFKGSCWWHVSRLFEHLRHGLVVCYVGQVWVNRRGDNDSFLEHGFVRRLGIAIDGYHDLSNHYFGENSVEAYHIRRLVRADLKFLLFLHAKTLTSEHPATESRQTLDRLVRRAYSDPHFSNWLARSIYFVMPVSAYKLVRAIWRWSRSVHLRSSTGRDRHA